MGLFFGLPGAPLRSIPVCRKIPAALSFIQDIIGRERFEAAFPELGSDLRPVVGRVVNNVKKDISHVVGKRLSPGIGVAERGVKVGHIEQKEGVVVVGFVYFSESPDRVELPDGKGGMYGSNPVVPYLVGIQDMAEEPYRLFRGLARVGCKDPRQLLVVVMSVVEQFFKKIFHELMYLLYRVASAGFRHRKIPGEGTKKVRNKYDSQGSCLFRIYANLTSLIPMHFSRRDFLKSSALVAGSAFSPIRGEMIGANDRLNVGLIGCRNMGWSDLSGFLNNPGVRCLGLADVDRSVLDKRGADLAKKQDTKFELYSDYRKLLDNRDIDAVIIGTPDHWHCLQFVDACKAGKDVYVEKPIANSIAECDVMVEAARKYGRIVQVGQQQRSGNHWKEMIRILRSEELGRIGSVKIWANFNYAALPPAIPDAPIPEGVDFSSWLGPAPDRTFNAQRFHGSWRMFWDYGGGLMTDWGVHLLDMGLWGMDVRTMPERITGAGGKFYSPEGAHETFDSQTVSYTFPGFIMSWEHNAGVESGPDNRPYGVLFKGTKGTLIADRNNWQIIPETDKATKEPRIPAREMSSDRREHGAHILDFIRCVKDRDFNTACSIETGSLAARYAHLGNIVARMGGASLRYDDQRKTFDNAQADQYLKPDYRRPWAFPG